MVLNFTRYPNSLILMSHYIAKEQIYLLIYKKTISLRRYAVISIGSAVKLSNSNPTSFFEIKKKILKNNFLETKLVSSTLRTVVLKLVYIRLLISLGDVNEISLKILGMPFLRGTRSCLPKLPCA